MKISTEYIRGLLKKTWPDLRQIWLTDPYYEPLNYNEVKEIVEACSLKNFDFTNNIWDCDNYALQLHAKVQKYQYDLIKSGKLNSKYSWAFGECIGFNDNIFSGKSVHAQNIAISDQVYLIEPQDGTISTDYKNYTPFFVRF